MKELHIFSFAHLMKMAVRYWQWFLLSVVICLCAAQLYLLYATPVYKISGRLMVSQADNYSHRASNIMLRYVNNVGTVSNTMGVENEVEVLWSSILMHDVVKSLKLYTEYQVDDWPKNRIVYATQPVNVDLDEAHLDSIDSILFDEYYSVIMKLGRKSDHDSTIIVRGALLCDNEVVGNFRHSIKSLPAAIPTPYGTLTFTHNPKGEPLTAGRDWMIAIVPPLDKAFEYMGRLTVELNDDHNSDRWMMRYFYKNSGIISLSCFDTDIRRGMDVLRQIAVSYNRQANSDKNVVALHTEAFINERLASLNDELSQKDRSIATIKQQDQLPSLNDAARMMVEADRYGSKLAEAEAQRLMLGYLEEYVSNPEHKYEIVPSNMGLSNQVTERMISQYNNLIQERQRLLRSASEEAPQVKRITAEADEMSAAIRTAFQQARQSAEIEQTGIGSQYARYKRKTSRAPAMEKALTDVGFQQKVKASLYKLLLQKREENSIALASTADHGRLIDEPLFEGKVRPRWWMAHGIALAVGIGVPYLIFFLLGFLRYKLENRKELEALTRRPIIAEVPMASENAKDKAGIVVRLGVNDTINETFRFMRTNIFFMLKGEGNTVLFTSSTSGEGKTFNAANFAMSCAMLDKKVILCGLDIRKPALGSLFGLADKVRGISILLRQDEVTEEDVRKQIHPSGIDKHLDLLLAGPIPPNPTELLASDSFGRVMAILRQEYDYVILDTAPVGLVTDTLQIARCADVTVFVCRAGYTPTHAINQLNALSEEKKLPNTCFVFNGVEIR